MLRVKEVRLQDFRVLSRFHIEFDELTVLVGENNVGKTSLLRAMDVALGTARPFEEDLHLKEDGSRATLFQIDVKVTPADTDEFVQVIRDLFEGAIQLPDEGPEYIVMRTTGIPNPDGTGLLLERSFLQGWATEPDQAQEIDPLRDRPRREQLAMIAFFLLDAQRDLVDELRVRGSHWGRLMSDMGVAAVVRAELERDMKTLGDRIVGESEMLAAVEAELAKVRLALGAAVQGVGVAPLPVRLDDMGRSMDVLVTAPQSAPQPMRAQGLGARSLASVMTFHAFTRMRIGRQQVAAPLSVAAFEEPEAHLHPQAQRAMFELIAGLPGQKIISTHSPHVAKVANIASIRVMRRVGAQVSVAAINSRQSGRPQVSAEELLKVERYIQRENGELLFARAALLFEGPTEDAAMPVFARAHWGMDHGAQGISMVSAGGAAGFKHFAPILDDLGIPWLIFADGDQPGEQGVTHCGTAIGRVLDRNSQDVVLLPPGQDFESYLVQDGHLSAMVAAIGLLDGPTAFMTYRITRHGTLDANRRPRDYLSPTGEGSAAVAMCQDNKTKYARAIAEKITESRNAAGDPVIPTLVSEAFARLDRLLGIST